MSANINVREQKCLRTEALTVHKQRPKGGTPEPELVWRLLPFLFCRAEESGAGKTERKEQIKTAQIGKATAQTGKATAQTGKANRTNRKGDHANRKGDRTNRKANRANRKGDRTNRKANRINRKRCEGSARLQSGKIHANLPASQDVSNRRRF